MLSRSENMNSFVQQALITFCSNHQMFGESSEYLHFDEVPVNNKGDGFRSQRHFGRIVYRTPTEEHQISPPIMLKITPKNMLHGMSVLDDFFNELFFYTRVVPVFQHLGDLQPLLPQFYDSHIRVSINANNFLLIFEDLQHQGFRTHPRHSFLDINHLLLMLRKLGHFHSFSYRAKQANPRHFHSLDRLFSNQLDMSHHLKWFQKYFQHGLQRLQQDSRYSHRLVLVEKVLDNASQYMERLETREQDQPLSVLCHGDFLRGNVLFQYKNDQPVDMKMIDMASCKVASPVLDLSKVLYLNANQRTRDEHWDSLIDAYCAGLQEELGQEDMPSRDSIMEAFRGRALCGYIIAASFLPVTMAIDAGKPTILDLLPKEYEGKPYEELPDRWKTQWDQFMGEEKCAEVLADILRDIIDRDFVSS